MDSERFPTKHDFFRALSVVPSLQLDTPVDHQASYDFSGDVIVPNLATFIHPLVFVKILQGFTNIGVDSSMRVKARFKLLGCVYNPLHTDIISFPTSGQLNFFLKWFIVNAVQMCGTEQYNTWSSFFSNSRVTVGRKRKATTTDNRVTWLLSEQQEYDLLFRLKFLKSVFSDSEFETLGHIKYGCLPPMSVDPTPVTADVDADTEQEVETPPVCENSTMDKELEALLDSVLETPYM